MKKNDVILIISLIIIAAILMVAINLFVKKDGAYAVITMDGKELASLALNKDSEYTITEDMELGNGSDASINVIAVESGKVYMKSADCPDRICVNTGKISKTGETIVCLPHKIVIEIKGNDIEVDGVAQ